MGERADQLRSDDPNEIRADIEQTRAEMSETIDAIQERMSPDYLKQQARDHIRDAAVGQYEDARDSLKGAGISMWDTIKQNPIPSALVGVGLGWLYMNRSSRSDHDQAQYRSYPRFQQAYNPRYGYEPSAGLRYDRGYDHESRSSDADSGIGQRVGESMRDAQDRVEDMASGVREGAEHAGHVMHHQVETTTNQVQRMYYQNPLGLGLVAVGAGLLAGLVIPETQREHDLMGPTRDHLFNEAREKIEDTIERVEHVAEEAQHAAMEEAREQGLTE